ncbi:MAG TPA: hypothetical protein VGA13_11320 [Acidimicrobiales bacterium]|jgi:hypothetical protein
MRTDIDAAVARLAARQEGTFARRQVLELGGNDSFIARRIRAGHWFRIRDAVFAIPGSPDRWPRQLWVAQLAAGPGSVVSYQSAAVARRLDVPQVPEPVITVSHPSHPRLRGITIHQHNDVRPTHVAAMYGGLSVTTSARTFADLAIVLRRSVLMEAIDVALVDRKVPVGALVSVLADLTRPGKPGVAKLAEVLEELAGKPPARSILERKLDDIVSLAGLPTPMREVPHPSPAVGDAFVDRWFPEAQLIVEADGRSTHARRRQLAKDRARDREASRLGIETARVVWEDVERDAQGTADALADIYAVRLRQLRPDAA